MDKGSRREASLLLRNVHDDRRFDDVDVEEGKQFWAKVTLFLDMVPDCNVGTSWVCVMFRSFQIPASSLTIIVIMGSNSG